MRDKLEGIAEKFRNEIEKNLTLSEVMNLKASFLGKRGELNAVLKTLKDAPIDVKKSIGKLSNTIKTEMQELIDAKIKDIETAEMNSKLAKNRIDISYRDSVKFKSLSGGGYHPVTTIQREIEDIFTSMGFDILDGPHIEDDYHNFEALNIPKTHPARDMQDTFWFSDMKHLLRTHTSCIQVRGMENHEPPFQFVGPGKVFRCEATDASHEIAFHQLEGMMVGENISIANLVYFMKTLLSRIFKKDINIRLRPGFFPFVEPGFELDIECLICGGKGCPVCKQQGWVELLPCGMVHPNVLKYGNIDAKKYNGFAFGLGLDRLVMMRYGIDDIRYIHSGDLRFISQFGEY